MILPSPFPGNHGLSGRCVVKTCFCIPRSQFCSSQGQKENHAGAQDQALNSNALCMYNIRPHDTAKNKCLEFWGVI